MDVNILEKGLQYEDFDLIEYSFNSNNKLNDLETLFTQYNTIYHKNYFSEEMQYILHGKNEKNIIDILQKQSVFDVFLNKVFTLNSQNMLLYLFLSHEKYEKNINTYLKNNDLNLLKKSDFLDNIFNFVHKIKKNEIFKDNYIMGKISEEDIVIYCIEKLNINLVNNTSYNDNFQDSIFINKNHNLFDYFVSKKLNNNNNLVKEYLLKYSYHFPEINTNLYKLLNDEQKKEIINGIFKNLYDVKAMTNLLKNIDVNKDYFPLFDINIFPFICNAEVAKTINTATIKKIAKYYQSNLTWTKDDFYNSFLRFGRINKTFIDFILEEYKKKYIPLNNDEYVNIIFQVSYSKNSHYYYNHYSKQIIFNEEQKILFDIIDYFNTLDINDSNDISDDIINAKIDLTIIINIIENTIKHIDLEKPRSKNIVNKIINYINNAKNHDINEIFQHFNNSDIVKNKTSYLLSEIEKLILNNTIQKNIEHKKIRKI